MTTRTSNSLFLTVLDAVPTANTGWVLRALSERDYSTVLCEIPYFAGAGFTKEQNAPGAGKVTLDADDPVLGTTVITGEFYPLVQQECLWQVLEDGIVRAEFLAEDLQTDKVTDNGVRTAEITGRGPGVVLDWAKVSPTGLPVPTSLSRTFNAHPLSVWYTLFLEAQAAGYLTWVTPLFDAVNDSAGNPYGPVQEITVQAGDSLLDLLTNWCEALGFVWKMVPGFRILLLPNTALGRDLTASIQFTEYRDQSSHELKETRREIANQIYATGTSGGSASVVGIAADTSSQTRWRKRASWVQAGGAGDATAASAVANQLLALNAGTKASRTIKVDPTSTGKHLFVDYDVTDSVSVEIDGAPEARQVLAATVDIDENGSVATEITLQSVWEARLVRQQKLLDKLGAQSVGGAGTSEVSTELIVKALISSQTLDSLGNVDTTGKADQSVIRWNATSGKWEDVVLPVAATTLDGLTDTTVASPANNQVLVYETSSGQWKNKTVPAQVLDWLSDATIASPANNDVLTYETSSSQWKNKPLPAAGNLDSLSDATIASPANDQVLVYESSSSQWKNKAVPAQTLDLLSDTTVASPANNEVLTYETSSGQWKNKPIPASNLDWLTDAQITSPANGQALIYDSGTSLWKNQSLPGQLLDWLTDATIVSPANNDVLTYETSSGQWKNKPASAGATNLDALTDATIASPANDQVLVYESSSSQWKNKAVPVQNLDWLSDVQSTSPSNGQVLAYETSSGLWKPTTPASGGATNLDGLSDVTVTGTPADGQLLSYDAASGQWKPRARITVATTAPSSPATGDVWFDIS